MTTEFSPLAPAWDRGPRHVGCGGPALDAGETRLRCARCGVEWSATPEEVRRARDADAAWLGSTVYDAASGNYVPAPPRPVWEARKTAEEQAKVARLREGRW